jgi:hypothetical protein
MTYWDSTQCCEDEQEFPKPASGVQRHLQRTTNTTVFECKLPRRIDFSCSVQSCAERLYENGGHRDPNVGCKEDLSSGRFDRHPNVVISGTIDPGYSKRENHCDV